MKQNWLVSYHRFWLTCWTGAGCLSIPAGQSRIIEDTSTSTPEQRHGRHSAWFGKTYIDPNRRLRPVSYLRTTPLCAAILGKHYVKTAHTCSSAPWRQLCFVVSENKCTAWGVILVLKFSHGRNILHQAANWFSYEVNEVCLYEAVFVNISRDL